MPTTGMFPPVGANNNARRISRSHMDSSDNEPPSQTSSGSSCSRGKKIKVGQVNIDTGLHLTKLKYCIPKSDGNFNLNTSLIDLVKKAKRWKSYEFRKE